MAEEPKQAAEAAPPQAPAAPKPAAEQPAAPAHDGATNQKSGATQKPAEDTKKKVDDTKADAKTAEKIEEKPKKKRFQLELSMTTWVLLVVMMVSLWLGQVLIFNTWKGETAGQEILIAEQERQVAGSQQLGNTLKEYEDEMAQINKSFPDESGLSQFAQKMDKYLRAFPEGKLQFDTSDPLVLPNEQIPTLPVTLSMLTTYDAFIQLMEDLAHSPYLFVPTDIQIAYNQENPQLVRIILKGRLYVSPIFQ